MVTLGRFLCAMLRLPCRQSDWLWSHDFELISMCETAGIEDCHGEDCYPL